jgi:hypothetical protein
MKKGAVPVPYIIALLLGIAVVAVLGYWFFVLGGQVGGEVTLQNCKSKATIYCNSWQTNGYAKTDDDVPNVPLIGEQWFAKSTETEDAYAPACSTHAVLLETDAGKLEDACIEFLATS